RRARGLICELDSLAFQSRRSTRACGVWRWRSSASTRSKSRMSASSLHDDSISRRVARACRRCRRSSDSAMTGVLLFGVDRFRTINDALGHATGDRLLIAIARRLEASVRVVDRVARRGVDEFAVLLENVDACAAERIAARLTRVLGKPFRIDGSDLVVTMSVGIAVATDDPLRDAGIALTRAKALGRARTVAFDPSMRVRATRAMTLEQELRAAVDRDSFSLMYQPIVDARSMRIRT